MVQSRKDLLRIDEKVDLEKLIQIPDWVGEGLYRCRVIYKHEVEKIEFFEYHFRHPKVIELIEAPKIEYPYKFEDRSQFQKLFEQNPKADDIFITHNGYLTDATFANIAFFDGYEWLTPDTPLLKGTKRQYLLDEKILKTAPIKVEDLKHFKQLSLINAMRDLNIIYDFTLSPNQIIVHGNY